MYEKNNVSMPVCAGDWWWQRPGSTSWEIVHVVTSRSRGLRWKGLRVHELGGFWTGPIPVPEDKPTCVCDPPNGKQHADDCAYDVPDNPPAPPEMSEDFGEPCKSCAHSEETLQACGFRPCGPPTARGCWYWKSFEAGALDPPEPSEDGGQQPYATRADSPGKALLPSLSEDEGEKWGRRLFWHLGQESPLKPWEKVSCSMQYHYQLTALRFRAECVKPYERLVEAARVVCNQVTGRDGLADEVCGLSVPPPLFPKPAHDAFAGERSDTDEPPKPTSRVAESIEDHELGRYAQDTLHMYLGESVSICLRADNLREYGAAIRAKLEGE